MILEKKKVIVTGGAGGIGSEICKMLLSKGAIVGCVDKNQNRLEKLCNQNKAFKDNLRTYCIDINDTDSVKSIVAKYYDEFSVIDILINNAAILDDCLLVSIFGGKIKKHSIERWNQTIGTNLTSYFVFAREVTEKMLLERTKGLIINISSISSAGN